MKTNQFFLYLGLFIGTFLFISCHVDDPDDCISDLGNVMTEVRDVNDFHSITFDGVGNIYLTQGSTQSLRIEANQGILDILETDVSDNLLSIEFDRCVNDDNFELDIYITIPDIRFLSLNGVGNLTAENAWDLDDLMVDMNGVGNITLQGTVDVLDINSNGVGNVKAFELIAQSCEVTVNGTGNVEVHAVDMLDVTINGAANVLYKGDPTISVSINGAGSLVDSN